ncbi:hormogonium polysaccharide biosynthesis protein HpsA [Nostoc sp. CHAB 5836]|uniref:hormogonium polysaccharide biosynthesis protein HpsA n=1 Tax=Nostoc sp. CHAB 5836 TaxID=2780404 RepID=UPI001E325BF5|nr:hormogonium polysaccharide biosynthesis protein HpsA [Nostoc sp. CHAB 5836]MCC5616782.1 hormogonium polysaccharide biosynthesis protein HpsA [Nostoc sp. CHAB 5836]
MSKHRKIPYNPLDSEAAVSQKRQLVKAIKKTLKQVSKQFLSAINKQLIWLLRTIFGTPRRRGSANAGFLLPTVAMVTLVVVLLTTAILFRSFERSKNASNVRVNEAVLNAATPAIDRARAKLDALLEDPTLPRGIPSDNALYDAIKKDKYRLGDETRLKLALEFNGITGIQTGDINNNGTPSDPSDDFVNEDETLKTAWKYAVDTDNNGKKDTFTLYGIYFRTPPRNSAGEFTRERKALEARIPPMDNDSSNQQCNASGFSSLVGNSSWYKLNSGNLGKSFFVYTVNVPITKQIYDSLPTSTGSINQSNSEEYKGNKSFVALEFQQDRSRVPLANNAVWFENDLEVIVGGSTRLLLNGRVHTNSNLLVGVVGTGGSNGNITFRQVSSKTSCFFNQENGQITVGGNVGNGSLSQTSANDVNVDLYKGFGNSDVKTNPATINASNKSTNASGGGSIGFNDAAYNLRIAAMKTTAIALCTTCTSATTASALEAAVKLSSYPADVITNVETKVQSTDDLTTAKNILSDEIEIYLRNRTRRVPFAEVPDATGTGATTGYSAISISLQPQASWREPLNSNNQFTGVATSPPSVETSQLQATQPNLQKKEGVQTNLGDRVFVGNNLPALWLKDGKYVGTEAEQPILDSTGTTVNWTRSGSEPPARWRNTQIQALADLGLSDRNGFWEENAAKNPVNELDNVGGVRIVTGAGIYVDDPDIAGTTTGAFYDRPTFSFLLDPPDPTPSDTTDIPVWPDTMPMSSPGSTTLKGDLLMRATAVYHYKVDHGTDQEPIACVSSYYDPSNEDTVKNKVNQNGGYGVDTTKGRSNNGVVYSYPTTGRGAFFTTHKARLQRQANLKFPNGRWANKPLQVALENMKATNAGTLPDTVPSSGLQLADYSAIDTALCAISILSNEAGFVATPSDQPKHGAIREATFLDAREVKQMSTSGSPTTYNLDLEQRQPLEIRVTDIDLSSTTGLAAGIATTAITANEYLLPYSGIIYASRDDGLRDESDTTSESELLSPTDFRLDSTRRPNGIRLINGGTLARTSANTYNAKEKGLILVTNLPAYIKGNFNLHRTGTTDTTEIEEFTEIESASVNFYDRSTANTNFACRAGRTGCPGTGGDLWRPATIIADSMTLLSDSFVDGVRRFADYDLNNNTGITVEDGLSPTTLPTLDEKRRNRLKNGFWENSYTTSSFWTGHSNGNGYPRTAAIGSYLTNGVTPIQRRVRGQPLYVMEICRNLVVSECGPNDWSVGFDRNGDGSLTAAEQSVRTYQLGQAILAANGGTMPSDWTTQFPTGSNTKSIRERLGAGDTGSDRLSLQGELTTDRLYPRRVAFARDNNNNLVTSSSGFYKPMGIGCPLDTTGAAYTNNGCTYGTNYGLVDTTNNIYALWFRTTNSTTNPGDIAQATYASDRPLFYYPPIDANGDGSPDLDGQPLLVPVLQIHDANSTPSNLRTDAAAVAAGDDFRTNWLQQASNTIFNATFVLGNSPSRTDEISAGLQNFVRFLENWENRTAKISGSFIQLKRSSFSTAPIASIFTNRQTNAAASPTYNLSLFDYSLDTYPTRNGDGILPFYFAPTNRNWGFDVGLLSEQPDLFAQRFTAPPTGRPNEFFREVGRDDTWVKTLLCAGEASNQTGIPTTGVTVTYTNAVPSQYRPSGCPSSIPSDLPPSP